MGFPPSSSSRLHVFSGHQITMEREMCVGPVDKVLNVGPEDETKLITDLEQ